MPNMVAIASLIITPFNPLLLQTLLSNYWTWLLLSLATIATTVLHTITTTTTTKLFPRSLAAPHTIPSPGPAISHSALPKRHQRSKSTSALNKLAHHHHHHHHHNLEGLNLASGLEMISSLFDDDSLVPRTLRQVASVSRLYDCFARQLGDKGSGFLAAHDFGFRGFLGLAHEPNKNGLNKAKEGCEGFMDGCIKKPQQQQQQQQQQVGPKEVKELLCPMEQCSNVPWPDSLLTHAHKPQVFPF